MQYDFNSIMQFLIFISIGFGLLYFRNRVKNLAQKDDLNDLTEIVEEVKQKYRSENESLKAQLAVLNDRKIQVFTEEKDAIIQFYTKINEWIWDKLNINLLEYTSHKYDALSERMGEMENTYNETNVLFSKVSLLVDNSEIINVGNDLIIATLKLQHLVIAHCSSYRHWLGASRANMEVIKNHVNVSPGKPLDSEFSEFVSEVDSKLENIRKELLDTKPALFNEAIRVTGKFEDLAKTYIRTPQQ